MSLENSPVREAGASASQPAQPQLVPIAHTVESAATVSTLSRAYLYRLIADGRLVARKADGRTIILDEDLRRCLASLPVIAPKGALPQSAA